MKNIIKRTAKKLDPKDLTVGILGYTGKRYLNFSIENKIILIVV
jgi:hypothetical protein